MSRTDVVSKLADEMAAKGVREKPSPSVFDSLGLGMTSRGLKRMFGTYDRGIGLVMAQVDKKPFVEKAIVEEPIVEIIDEGVMEDDPEDIEDAE